MPTLQNLDDEKGEENDNAESLDEIENTEFEIPSGLPGARNSRRRPANINYSRPESIDIDNPQRVYKRRGRPVGSGRKTTKSQNTRPEQFWINLTSTGLGFATAVMAAKVFQDAKYRMTKTEAESAANALMLVLFKYKWMRDVAVLVNFDNDWGIIAKGFFPYLNRVFLQEIIQDVIAGLFVPTGQQQPKQRQQFQQPKSGGISGSTEPISNPTPQPIGKSETGKSTGSGNSVYDNGRSEFTVPESILGTGDWRAV